MQRQHLIRPHLHQIAVGQGEEGFFLGPGHGESGGEGEASRFGGECAQGVEGGDRGGGQIGQAEGDGRLQRHGLVVRVAQSLAGQGETGGGVGQHCQRLLPPSLGAPVGIQIAAEQFQRQGQAIDQGGQPLGSGRVGDARFRGQGRQQVIGRLRLQHRHVDALVRPGKTAGKRLVARGQQGRHAGRATAQLIGRLPLPHIIQHQQEPPVADGVGQPLGTGVGVGQVAQIDAQGIAPSGLDAGDIGQPPQTGPENAVAKMGQDLRVTSQRHRQGRLAHAGQPVGGKRGRLAGTEALHQIRDQFIPAQEMVGQRRHANIEKARWRRAGVVMDVFVQVATGKIAAGCDVACHRAALRSNVRRSIRHGVLPR